MSTLMLLLCHPNSKSFTHAVGREVYQRLEKRGHQLTIHDLYAEGFDPVLSHGELRRRFSLDELVQRHYRDLESADGIIVIHPEWWNQPPALLKGWIDRVLRPGIGYEFEGEEFMPKSRVPLLGGKRALVLATTDSDAPTSSEGGDSPGEGAAGKYANEPLLSSLWRETFGFCGIVDYHFRMFYDMRNSDPSDRRGWIEEVSALAGDLFP